MPEELDLASQISILLNGSEVQQPEMAKLIYASVEQSSHLPSMFMLRFLDPDLEMLDKGPFDLTKEVEIKAKKSDGKEMVLIKGEITALDPEFREGMIADLTVRGYDRSHRLFREMKSKAYLNVKDSDLASQIAQSAGLQIQSDVTNTVYEHIFQHNQTDLGFLMQRAWRIGYECFISESKLYFRKPPQGGEAVTLTWGADLLSFRPRMSLSEQVDEVIVKGWDINNLSVITGRANNGKLYPQIGEAKNGADWAHPLGTGKLVIVDQPVINQSEANTLAQARLDEMSGAFIEADGEAFRRPDIQAGKAVKIDGLGDRFSGTYLVTSATHVFSPVGLKTMFTLRGARTGLISEQFGHLPVMDRWIGVVPALVTNTDDPNDMGRIKVKYPWMTEDSESHWARVIGAGAGPDAGLFILPDVGDEVFVCFIHGDFNQPVVLGGSWNGKHKLPKEVTQASKGEKPLVRTWHSRKGHMIAVYDNADKKIEIKTSDGRSVTLSDKDRKITLKTNQVTVVMEDAKITIDSGTDVSVKAGTNLTLEATANMQLKANGNLDIQATGQLNLKGTMVNIN